MTTIISNSFFAGRVEREQGRTLLPSPSSHRTCRFPASGGPGYSQWWHAQAAPSVPTLQVDEPHLRKVRMVAPARRESERTLAATTQQPR